MGLTTTTNDRRFNLDEIDERMKDLDRQELAVMGIDPDKAPAVAPPDPAASTTPVTKTPDELEQENAALRRQLETARAMVRDLAAAAPVNNKALQRRDDFLARWSQPAQIAELEVLVYKMLPNAKQIGVKGAQLVARRAVALGLDPFVEGNLWAYVDDGIIRVRTGYLGHRERIEAAGLIMVEPRRMTDEERALHGLGEEDHGAVVEVWDPRKKEEFERNGLAYRPVLGTGIWRPDEKKSFVPVGRSGYWRAETRATNDAGKRAVRQSLDALRWLQGLDATVSEDGDLWSTEADPPATWTQDPTRKAKAEEFLAGLGLTDEIVNQALGMDWHRTWMEPDDFFNFVRLVADSRKRDAVDGEYTVRPEPAAPTIEAQPAPVSEPPAEPPVEQPAQTVDAPPAETPTAAKTKKTAAPKTVMCANCKVEPAVETPLGSAYCATCATRLADQKAAQP
jgi:hypothetical protein